MKLNINCGGWRLHVWRYGQCVDFVDHLSVRESGGGMQNREEKIEETEKDQKGEESFLLLTLAIIPRSLQILGQTLLGYICPRLPLIPSGS